MNYITHEKLLDYGYEYSFEDDVYFKPELEYHIYYNNKNKRFYLSYYNDDIEEQVDCIVRYMEDID